jgi:hypothetical protein
MKLALSRVFATLVGGAAFLGSVGPAQGAPIVFQDQTAFETAAASAGVPLPLSLETFGAFALGLLPQTANGITVSTDNNGSINFGAYNGGSHAVIFSTQEFGTSITFNFPSPIHAFGVSVYDLGTVGPTDLSITTTAGAQLVYNNFESGRGNILFAGVIDATTAFSSVTVTNTQWDDYVELDNVTYGASAVPEPGTLALLGAGLAGLRSLRRKRAA